jgi:hypothetical protein
LIIEPSVEISASRISFISDATVSLDGHGLSPLFDIDDLWEEEEVKCPALT